MQSSHKPEHGREGGGGGGLRESCPPPPAPVSERLCRRRASPPTGRVEKGVSHGLNTISATNPHPRPALSLTHDPLCVLSMDIWWTFGHELKKQKHNQRNKDTRYRQRNPITRTMPEHRARSACTSRRAAVHAPPCPAEPLEASGLCVPTLIRTSWQARLDDLATPPPPPPFELPQAML